MPYPKEERRLAQIALAMKRGEVRYKYNAAAYQLMRRMSPEELEEIAQEPKEKGKFDFVPENIQGLRNDVDYLLKEIEKIHLQKAKPLDKFFYSSSESMTSAQRVKLDGIEAGADITGNHIGEYLGSLGASAWIVASNAPTKVKTFATILQTAGYPVWVCDGTADDIQIQAALDTGVKSIDCSEGTFTIATAVTIPGSNVVIRGQGRSTVFKRSANVSLFTANGGAGIFWDIEFRDLTFASTRTTYTGTAVALTNCAQSKFHNVKFTNIDGIALQLDKQYGMDFVDGFFNECGNATSSLAAVVVKATTDQCTNLKFTRTLFEPNHYADVDFQAPAQAWFTDCYWEGELQGALYVPATAHLISTSGAGPVRVRISHPQVWDPVGSTVRFIRGDYWIPEIKGGFIGNGGTGGSQIDLLGTAVSKVNVEDILLDTSTGHGIASNSDDAYISGVRAVGATYNGFYLLGYRVRVIGNQAKSCGKGFLGVDLYNSTFMGNGAHSNTGNDFEETAARADYNTYVANTIDGTVSLVGANNVQQHNIGF